MDQYPIAMAWFIMVGGSMLPVSRPRPKRSAWSAIMIRLKSEAPLAITACRCFRI